jgi:hypothetical protein
MAQQAELELRTRVAAGRQRSLAGWFSFRKIHSIPHGSLIVRLMMAANDIQLANWSLVGWHEKQPRMRCHMQQGAIQYFLRLQCGHLREAIKLVRELRKEPDLMDRLSRCTPEARQAFASLVDCLRDGPNYQKYEDLIGRMRDKIAFHYDPAQVTKALKRLAEKTSLTGKVTLGMDVFLERFNLADAVTNTIFVREIMGVEPGGDVNEEFNRIRDFVNKLCTSYLRFVREFATNHLRECAPA